MIALCGLSGRGEEVETMEQKDVSTAGRARGAVAAVALALAALAGVPAGASAQVTLPNGMIVPVDSRNGEIQLFTFFASRGEGIDWISDARRTPDTFSPLCDFTASLVLNEAGLRFGVGWYNADPAATAPPSGAEIYPIVPAGSPIGTTITGASIRDDPRYAGGLIGFALMRSPPHFTEARWNTVCDSGPCAGSPGPWILSLTYPSTREANAWYIAFEDGDTSASSWNNDGDYNDDVFFFTGIACAGAAERCEVDGALGICRGGLTECGTGGALSCRQVVDPSDEDCDGADNDCDGLIDEGDMLCSGVQVCDRGRCIEPCFEGTCGAGEVCLEGRCFDAACEGMDCPEGERCEAGACVALCDGVVCPGDQVCRGGACVDACAGVTCDAGRVCEGGICVESCACRPCGAGRDCDPSGSCVEAGCVGVSCGAGETCRGGACVDACAGAVCPSGEICREGACVEDPGVPARDAGTGRDAGGTPDAGSGGSDAGSGGSDAGAMDAGRGGPGGSDGGCGCRVGGGSPAGAPLAPLCALAIGLGLFLRRRRR